MSDAQPESFRALKEAWSGRRRPLVSWVRSVEDAFSRSNLVIADAAELIDSTEAELEAVLRLCLLEDNILDLVSEADPPMTTWLLLTEVPSADIPEVLEAASNVTTVQSDYQRMDAAIREVTGRSSVSAVQNIDPDLLDFALRKATAYSIWPQTKKHYRALRDFASRRRSSRPLTARQTAYARSLLNEIVESGAIRVPSPDGDDELCGAILKAIS